MPIFEATLGGRPVQSLPEELANRAHHGWDAPPELARANQLLNPLGREPARGWLLLVRSDLDALGLDGLHDLTLSDGEGTVLARNLVITREPVGLTQSIFP